MWFLIAIIAHAVNAFAFISDKVLLTKRLPEPGVPAFWVNFASAAAFALLIFDPKIPASAGEWGLDFLGGFLFAAALVTFYVSLKFSEASRVVPIVGGSVPIFTAILSAIFLGQRLGGVLWISIVILTIGAFVIARGPAGLKKKLKIRHGAIMLLAGLLFAASFVSMDAIFAHQGFLAGFAWSRIGAFAGAILLFLHPPTRKALLRRSKEIEKGTVGLLFMSQGAGGLGFFLINFAISLKSATYVNALQGLQYAFLFIFMLILSKWMPNILKESLDRRVIFQKSLGILIIILGIVLLSLE